MRPSQLAIIGVAATFGWSVSRFWPLLQSSVPAPSRKVLLYQSPMHPWVKSNKPGQCTVCGMDLVPVYEGGETFDLQTKGVVLLPQGSPNVVGVKTVEVKKQALARTLRVAGMIVEDETRHGIICAPADGRIDGLAMTGDGDKVNRRQPLVTLFSRTLLSAANDYKIALEQNSSAIDVTKRRLEQYGLVWEQINAIPQRQPEDVDFGILSPLSGHVVKSYVSEGQYVKEGERLFEIADFTQMWFIFNAYEQDLPALRKGQIVTLQVPSLPGVLLKSKIDFISPNLDETTRSARIRVVLENHDGLIKNKTYAAAVVELDAPEVMVIPRSAVLWPGGSPRVYVELSAGTYQRREIKIGRAGDASWEVLDGLKNGESVVEAGSMLIDGQAQLNDMAITAPIVAVIECSTEMKTYLSAVVVVTSALANDDLAAANVALENLPAAPDGRIKTPAPLQNGSLTALRKEFLPWSQEIASFATGLTNEIPQLKIFRCPMTTDLWPGAPANAKWIQLTSDLHNPYWGKEMQDCGMEVKP